MIFILHFGDITKINGAEAPMVDVITGGSPCLAAGTLITTDSGLVPIENIKIGDKVLTHNNHFMPVADSGCTGEKLTQNLYGMACDKITATPNHPFYVRKLTKIWNNNIRRYERNFSNPEWVELKDLSEEYYLGSPVNNISDDIFGITEEEAYLLGRYVADGYVRNAQRPGRKDGSLYYVVIYCIGKSKKDDFISNIITYKYGVVEERTVYKVRICSKRLTELCLLCGKGAENKFIPPAILNLPISKLQSFFDGYMQGDGCKINNTYSITTVSRRLAYNLAQIIAKLYHRPCSIKYNKQPKTTVIENRTVNCRDFYTVRFKKEVSKQDKAFYEDGYIWFPIRRIENNAIIPVYNLSVGTDESYCANGVIVHNCQDLSVAGRRQGLAGERSGLFMEQMRIVKQMREASKQKLRAEFGEDYDKTKVSPRYMVWENVCLLGTSLIDCEDGTKQIKDVQVGDQVLTHNHRYMPVVKTYVHTDKEVVQVNITGEQPLICTPNHPIYGCKKNSDGSYGELEFIPAGLLTSEHRVASFWDDKIAYKAVESVTSLDKKETVYNLSVAEDNTYVANGIICHNCGAYSSGTPEGADFQAVLEEIARVVLNEVPTIPIPTDGWPYAGNLEGVGEESTPFSICWRTHDAQYWGKTVIDNCGRVVKAGTPQRRRRIALVADFGGSTAPEILFEREGLSGNTEQSGETRQGTPGTTGESVEKSGTIGFHLTQDPVSSVEKSYAVSCGSSMHGQCVNGVLTCEDVISDPVQKTYKKDAHAKTSEDGQGWVETDVNDTLNAFDSGETRTPTLVVNDSAAEPILLESNQNHATVQTDGVSTTLPASMGEGGGYVPMVVNSAESSGSEMCYGFEPGVAQRVDPETRFSEEVSPTLRAKMGDNQASVVYGVCSYDSNAMKSDNPHSGIYEADTSRTLDLNGGNPGCNQGGMIVLEGNGSRPSHKGDGYSESETMYTLNATEQHAVCLEEPVAIESHPQDSRVKINSEDINQTISSNMAHDASNGGLVLQKTVAPIKESTKSYGVTTKGNGDAFISEERHTSLSTGGGEAGQGYPCVLTEQQEPVECLNGWDVQSKHIQSEDGVAESLYSGECRYGGGESYVMQTQAYQDVTVFTDTGFQDICQDDVAFTLRARDYKSPQTVAIDMGGGKSGCGISEEQAPTLTTTHGREPAVYGFKPDQGSKAHGMGFEEEKSPTLSTCNNAGVLSIENHPNDSRIKVRDDGTVQTLSSRMGTGGNNTPMVMATEPQAFSQNQREEVRDLGNKAGAVSAEHGTHQQTFVSTAVVRRLTPGECELLQGFPKNWTFLGEWTDTKGKKHKDSDSARYKALGNSIALPFWDWMAGRMCEQLRQSGVEHPTMASLFSGIGGFEFVYKLHGCEPIWSSEIEEFPIAVTKKHFGDDDENLPGDYEQYINNPTPFYIQNRPSTCLGLDRASFNQGQNAKYDFSVEDNLAQTLVSRGPGGVMTQ